MTRSSFRILAYTTFVNLLTTAVIAISPADSAGIQELEEKAIARDERVGELRAAYEVECAAAESVIEVRDPELRGKYGQNSTEDTNKDLAQYEMALRFYPPNLWTRSSRKASADARLQTRKNQIRLAEWDCRMTIRELYIKLDYLKQKQALMNSLLETRQHYQQAMKDSLAQGAATTLDTLAAGLSHMEASYEQRCIDLDIIKTAGMIEQRCGCPATLGAALYDKPHEYWVALCAAPEQVTDLAFTTNARIQLVQAESAEMLSETKERIRGNRPWLSHIQCAYQWEEEEKDHTWLVQAAINLPLLTPFLTSDRSIRAAQIIQQETAFVNIHERISRNIRVAIENLGAVLTHVAAYRDEAEPLLETMETTLTSLESQPEASRGFITKLQENIFKTRLSLLDAQYKVTQALWSLELAVGSTL